jgi:Flp pilus assembly protein TadG
MSEMQELMMNRNLSKRGAKFGAPVRNWRECRSRRRGSVIVYVALGIVVFIGTASLSVDMGNLYNRKAKSQTAADAAALAGAYQLSQFRDNQADKAAREAADANGYKTDPARGITVTTTYPVPGQPKQYRVRVARREPMFFARIFGLPTRNVASTATAEYDTLAPLSITGGGVYGQPDGPTNLSVFGPMARYDFGDFRSTKFLLNGQPNPDYTGRGYNFTVNVPSSYTDTVLEIYDPDCYNAGGQRFVQAGVRVDELRKEYTEDQSGAIVPSDITTTKYTLYWDPKGNGDPSQLKKIGEKSFGDDSTTDMKWNSVFNFNRADYVGGNFLLNVTSTSGASENAFNLRAGPPLPAGANFDPNNGTSITADGFVPMNFNGDGAANIEIGNVPVEAAGHQLSIRKFDTDVGSKVVNYTYLPTGSTTPSKDFPGILSNNGEFYTDTYGLPLSYPGGTWTAHYTAGANDTSVWEMSYTGGGPGKPGGIRLVE